MKAAEFKWMSRYLTSLRHYILRNVKLKDSAQIKYPVIAKNVVTKQSRSMGHKTLDRFTVFAMMVGF